MQEVAKAVRVLRRSGAPLELAIVSSGTNEVLDSWREWIPISLQ